MPIPKAGDQLPDVLLYEATPLDKIIPGVPPIKAIKLRDVFAGKTGILVNVPGGFTPGCTKTHLPGYLANLDELKASGAEVIVFTAVNDPYVLTQWGASAGAIGKVMFLADMHCKLTEALDVVEDMTSNLGSKRGKRLSAIIKDNEILQFNPDEALTCSLADPTLIQLKAINIKTSAA